MRAHPIMLCIALAGLLLPGCGSDGGGGGGLSVSSQPDHFSIAGIGGPYTAVHAYSWSCSTSQANVSIAQGISNGSIRLTILDGAGTLVHDNTYAAQFIGAIAGVTAPGGVPGTWTVTFIFTDASAGGAIAIDADLSGQADAIQVAGGYNTTSSLVYAVGWPAGAAAVDLSAGLSSGSLRIRVWDAVGMSVFDVTFPAPINIDMSALTAAGAAGTWAVQVDFTATQNGSAISLTHP